MYKKSLLPLLLWGSTLAYGQSGDSAIALSERDYWADVPVVLSVSRLAQRLDETPGAVTILDRTLIRMSGARDVVDLLRLVPGFQTTTAFETDAPIASYHGRNDDWANRIQVLVDGRSVYSGYLQGSAGLGWQTLALDDIERIEVLRGSNSAAYGARAFLGVVNIISRDVRETEGYAIQTVTGQNGVADVGARVGWGDVDNMFRLSMDSRGDDGLRKEFASDPGKSAAGTNRISRVNFVSHVSDVAAGDLELRAGALEVAAVRGTSGPDSEGNRERLRFLGSQYLQLDWKKTVSDDEDFAVSASRTRIFSNDSFPYLSNDASPNYFGIPIALKADEYNDALSVQHTVRHSKTLRTVWGGELRREQIQSPSSFDTREQVTSQFARVFVNAEWRALSQVVVNAGAMAEASDIGGDTFSPRLMLNWHIADGHTLRAGVSTAFRPPSAFEKYADVKYYDLNGLNPLPYVKASGHIEPEKVEVRELGYALNLAGGVSGDLRVFHEKIMKGIGSIGPGYGPKGEFANGDNYTITGAEYQVAWKPTHRTQVLFNQTWTHIRVDSLAFPNDFPHPLSPELYPPNALFKIAQGAPKLAGALTLMHTLRNNMSLSLMHQRAEDFALVGDNSGLYSMRRTDLRVAQPFKVGSSHAEVAVTLQNLGVPYNDGDKKFFFDRRALVSLRIEF